MSPAQEDPLTLQAFWKDGLVFTDSDDHFRLRLGGRLHNDWAFMAEDEELEEAGFDFEDGIEFRRARLILSGRIYERLNFKIDYNFSGGTPEAKSLWLAWRQIPYVGEFRVGYFKEPFGIEPLTSTNYLTFLEWALPKELAPGRAFGCQFTGCAAEGRIGWAGGLFRAASGEGVSQFESKYDLTAHCYGLPSYTASGKRFFRLGLSGSIRDPHRGEDGLKTVQYQVRPEAHLAPYVGDTGLLDDADRIYAGGGEAAYIWDQFMVQGEYVRNWVESARFDNPQFRGYYVQASVFLTGEQREYSLKRGRWGRVRPKNNFLHKGGLGAWEAAWRYSKITLNDHLVRGGKVQDFTFGLNWYLNPNTRIMFNYIHTLVNRFDVQSGNGHLFLVRFQVDF